MEKMGELLARLVSDLPSMGGWPEWAVECILHRGSCKAMFYDNDGRFNGYPLFPNIRFKEEALVERVVHREMYEAAVSSSKPEWDGEGLPPVGTEAEVSVDGGRTWCLYKATSEHNGMRLVEIGDFTEEFQSNNWMFRPIRSEADKKRDEIIEALKEGLGHAHGLYDLMQVYHLLKDGNIPHIRID